MQQTPENVALYFSSGKVNDGIAVSVLRGSDPARQLAILKSCKAGAVVRLCREAGRAVQLAYLETCSGRDAALLCERGAVDVLTAFEDAARRCQTGHMRFSLGETRQMTAADVRPAPGHVAEWVNAYGQARLMELGKGAHVPPGDARAFNAGARARTDLPTPGLLWVCSACGIIFSDAVNRRGEDAECEACRADRANKKSAPQRRANRAWWSKDEHQRIYNGVLLVPCAGAEKNGCRVEIPAGDKWCGEACRTAHPRRAARDASDDEPTRRARRQLEAWVKQHPDDRYLEPFLGAFDLQYRASLYQTAIDLATDSDDPVMLLKHARFVVKHY